MKTTIVLFIFLTVFSLNTIAQDFSPIILEGHRGDVLNVSFSPDGSTIASGESGREVSVYGMFRTGNVIHTDTHPDTLA